MKKILSVMVILTMVFALAACGTANSGESHGEEGNEKENKKVGLIIPMTNEFFSDVSNKCISIWEKEGYTTTTVSYDWDTAKAIESIENFVAAGVDMICINPGGNGCDDALKSAMEAGVKVYTFGVETPDYDVCLVADEYEIGSRVGEMAAGYINDTLKKDVEAVALVNTSSEENVKRCNGIVETFEELCPGSEIVAEVEIADVGEGTTAMETVLQQHPNVQIVMAYTDTAAIEAMETLKAAGKSGADYAVYGTDGTEEAFKLVSSGEIMRGTCSSGDIGTMIGNVGKQCLLEEVTFPYKTVIPFAGVTIDNIDEYYTK